MVVSSLLRALVCPLAVFVLANSTFAQDSPPAPPAPLPLEKITALAAQLDEDLRKQIDDTRAVIETESTAKRLEPAIAQNLLYALRASAAPNAMEFRIPAMARNNPVTPDQAVNDALQKLDTLSAKIAMDRSKLAQDALLAARHRTAEMARSGEKSSDFDSLITQLESIERSIVARATNSSVYAPAPSSGPTISSCLIVLRNLQAALVARDSGDAKLLGEAIIRLRNGNTFPQGIAGWSGIEAQQRITALLKPYSDAIAPAQTALDEMLLARGPADKLAAGLAKLEEVTGKLQAAQGMSTTIYSDTSSSLNTYRSLVALARAVENHDASYMQGNLQTLRHNLTALGAERVNKFEQLFVQWQKETDEAAGHITQEQRSAWGGKLAAVKDADQLQALAFEMQKAERNLQNVRDPDFPRGLGSQLLALATAWSNGSNSLAAASGFGYDSNASVWYAREINDLRQRIQRDTISHALRAPELLKSPLAEQPLDTALDTLSRNLSEAHEWRRLLVLLELHANSNRYNNPGGSSSAVDTMNAIRQYFAGQNYELAEQWSDALVSYKSVLATAAELGPIKEAAERIKVISKEHPKSFVAPATPAPTGKSSKR